MYTRTYLLYDEVNYYLGEVMKKRLIVEVSEKFHNDLRLRAFKQNATIKGYVLNALIDYIKKEMHEQESKTQ